MARSLNKAEFASFIASLNFPAVFVPLFSNNALKGSSCMVYDENAIVRLEDAYAVEPVLLLVRRSDVSPQPSGVEGSEQYDAPMKAYVRDRNDSLHGTYDVINSVYYEIGFPDEHDSDRDEEALSVQDKLGIAFAQDDFHTARVLIIDLNALPEDDAFPKSEFPAFFHRLNVEVSASTSKTQQARTQARQSDICVRLLTVMLVFWGDRFDDLHNFFRQAQEYLHDASLFKRAFEMAAPSMTHDAFLSYFSPRQDLKWFLIQNNAFALPGGNVMFPEEAKGVHSAGARRRSAALRFFT